MSNRKPLVVLHCPAGGGHKAAARAVAEAAEERGLAPVVVDALALTPPWFARAYVGAHLTGSEHAPVLYGSAFAALNRRHSVGDTVRAAFDRTIGAALRRHVSGLSPVAVVATHFFPLAVLGQARRRGKLRAPVVGVVTDHGAHAFWAERGVDRFCTPRGRAAADLARHGVAAERIVATGIPVRPAFGAVAPMRPPCEGEPLRVLVTSGGFGVGPMLEVIGSFAGAAAAELTVVCGNNPQRVEQARRAAAAARVRARVVGFERDMPARIAEAHVVVGKAGGLTVSETLAAGRPMILVGTCPGQEVYNEAWVVSNGAGLAARPEEVGRLVQTLRARERLAELAQGARDAGEPGAAAAVVRVALHEAGLLDRTSSLADAA